MPSSKAVPSRVATTSRRRWPSITAAAPVTEALADRMLKLCDARQITTEQFVTRGERWISRPQLEEYIATLQPQGGAA
jgi:hypothetical protein